MSNQMSEQGFQAGSNIEDILERFIDETKIEKQLGGASQQYKRYTLKENSGLMELENILNIIEEIRYNVDDPSLIIAQEKGERSGENIGEESKEKELFILETELDDEAKEALKNKIKHLATLLGLSQGYYDLQIKLGFKIANTLQNVEKQLKILDEYENSNNELLENNELTSEQETEFDHAKKKISLIRKKYQQMIADLKYENHILRPQAFHYRAVSLATRAYEKTLYKAEMALDRYEESKGFFKNNQDYDGKKTEYEAALKKATDAKEKIKICQQQIHNHLLYQDIASAELELETTFLKKLRIAVLSLFSLISKDAKQALDEIKTIEKNNIQNLRDLKIKASKTIAPNPLAYVLTHFSDNFINTAFETKEQERAKDESDQNFLRSKAPSEKDAPEISFDKDEPAPKTDSFIEPQLENYIQAFSKIQNTDNVSTVFVGLKDQLCGSNVETNTKHIFAKKIAAMESFKNFKPALGMGVDNKNNPRERNLNNELFSEETLIGMFDNNFNEMQNVNNLQDLTEYFAANTQGWSNESEKTQYAKNIIILYGIKQTLNDQPLEEQISVSDVMGKQNVEINEQAILNTENDKNKGEEKKPNAPFLDRLASFFVN